MTAVAAPLPQPARQRWQPLRLGLVELFRYDSEEFWFRDGHLLLRGNNGTGKSKVLSLTLPLLLDANLRSSRVEPDGDPGKKMAWNLLLGDPAIERRTGYSWIEFGRIGDDGQPQFLTLGLGLHAVAARSHQVESWYFIAEGIGEGALRIGRGLWLLSAQRQVPTRERLREALGSHGAVFEQAQAYRRAVDERLFQLGQRRYGALIDTLIQLRQPQLSRRPDERALSAALTESLPPLAPELLGDVADALTQLEDLRQGLERTQRLHQAVTVFEQRYRIYAGIASRRQARGLRQAQTAFDNASRLRHDAQQQRAAAAAAQAAAQQRRDSAATLLAGARTRLETLLADPLNTDADRLQRAADASRQRERELADAGRDAAAAQARADSEAALLAGAAARDAAARQGVQHASQAAQTLAVPAGLAAALAEQPWLAGTPQDLAEQAGGVHPAGQAGGAHPAGQAGGGHQAGQAGGAHQAGQADNASQAGRADGDYHAARRQLLALPGRRRDDLQLVRRRLQALSDAAARVQPLQQALAERRGDAEDAAAALAQADDAAEQQAQAHVEAWGRHLDGLRELQIDADAVLDALAPWLQQQADGAAGSARPASASPASPASPADQASLSEHPALAALRQAQGVALSRLADERAALARQRTLLADERTALQAEAGALAAGVDPAPPAPAWRDPTARHGQPGAPLWQLVDFAPAVAQAGRDGLEAALLAAGLLDAWVTPDGRLLQGADGQPWLDTLWQPRPGRPGRSLAGWLQADAPAASGVAATTVQALLAGIACAADDDPAAEAWVAPDGRFRLAGLHGAAAPAPARHIGHAARQAARARRQAEIAARLADMATELHGIVQADDGLDARARRIADEWQQAPSDQRLRSVLAQAAAALRALAQARQREAEAQTRWQQAEQAAQAARAALEHDAADLRLPTQAAALDAVDATLHACTDAFHQLAAAVRELLSAVPLLALQQQRQADAQQQLQQRQAQQAQRAQLAEEARAHAAALEAVLGQQVHTLKQQLDRARALVKRLEGSDKRLADALIAATEGRAVADAQQRQGEQRLEQATAARTDAADSLRRFAATGLLASGLAGSAAAAELPDATAPWTIDPALTLARRVEQALAALDDGDEAWQRAQQRVTEDLQALQRALSALGETASATTHDFGFAVHVQWQQRAWPPEALAAQLQADLLARQTLLSARERTVLENHLQAEIASQIQALMRAASRQVAAINDELQRRPTSTGVRFRLQWQALPEGQGAPAGLHAARERLLNTAAALWTADDRRAFGALLQQRIQDERQRGDGVAGDDGGGSLLDQLARALDYRQWHQFRVERWQDGLWRKLSGPASSGERALGLTVPLFAAVATFYGNSPLAPRLMLLDEAFAGIDDAARAHCMALVREFDLDFVITSEREWGCYAELPGVAICQLQRREGIDAVHVSRWTWDGSARRPDAAPARSLAPQPVAVAAGGDDDNASA